MKDEIKKALDKAESQQGYFESKKAHEWLRWQNERIEHLEKALEEIAEYDVRLLHGFIDEWEDAAAFGRCQEIARQALGKEE